jgi:glyoxylase-like metal-dependent hydrolase (beta-lactamase superfamily II)
VRLHVIHSGNFKLDGGAMFGVVPKSIWQRSNPADENNLCTWAMRCLLIEDGDRLILIDTGIGDKQSEKFFGHFHLHGPHSLFSSLRAAGFEPADITDVFLTHLHFDHCGGGVRWADRAAGVPEMVFPQARYWSNVDHWKWAIEPNARERASFLKENLLPMQESGQLEFAVPGEASPFPQFDILFVSGHTEKMMVPLIGYRGRIIAFAADLLPSAGHVPLPYIMSYDTRPLLTLEEKSEFLLRAAGERWIVFFEHDPVHECCTLTRSERGVVVDRLFDLSEIG